MQASAQMCAWLPSCTRYLSLWPPRKCNQVIHNEELELHGLACDSATKASAGRAGLALCCAATLFIAHEPNADCMLTHGDLCRSVLTLSMIPGDSGHLVHPCRALFQADCHRLIDTWGRSWRRTVSRGYFHCEAPSTWGLGDGRNQVSPVSLSSTGLSFEAERDLVATNSLSSNSLPASRGCQFSVHACQAVQCNHSPFCTTSCSNSAWC